ncbi:AABR07011733.1 [Phodopus roborovskii]|uniref:LINE-1 retrotransposable element ORF1 protein n=1 Tax=Phodopus roborovskii TaxID=109678 RepID=A0AAV0AG78_PHORO|nr:AABR07011733.1 [Phodopus roborovskii]
MGRRQYKRTPNNRKTNMTPPESRESTTTRMEHNNTAEEAEGYDLKITIIKMIEALKEDMRKSLKEIEEKTNKKVEEMNKFLKESTESQEKTINQVKETVQDLKTEIEKIKATQMEGKLEIEKLGKKSETTDTSITNRIQEMEERISGAEDKLEEIDSSTKENHKSNKSLTQNIQEMWDTMKRPNLRIIGIEEGEEAQLKGAENIFNKIIEENFPNLKKDMPMKVQEAYRTPNRLDQRKKTPRHIIIKTPSIQNKERILRAAKEKGQVTYKGRPIKITPDFSMETLKARRSWIDVLKVLREHGCQPRLLYPAKLSVNIDGENKIFNDKTRFSQYVSTNPALQKVLEGKFQPKEGNYAHKNVGNR